MTGLRAAPRASRGGGSFRCRRAFAGRTYGDVLVLRETLAPG
jgi:hypothetical protein